MNNPESGTGVSSLESISSIFNIKINVDTISVSVEEASNEIHNLESYSPTITKNIGQPEKMWINIINWIVAAVTAISIFRDIWEATSKKSATKKMQEGIEQFTNSLTTMKDNLNKANLETVGKAIGDVLIAGLKTAIEDIKLLLLKLL
jgi:hypothetical protein